MAIMQSRNVVYKKMRKYPIVCKKTGLRMSFRLNSNPSVETHPFYYDVRNHAKSNLLKTISSMENVKIFPIITLLVIFSIYSIISPTILLLDLSLLYFN